MPKSGTWPDLLSVKLITWHTGHRSGDYLVMKIKGQLQWTDYLESHLLHFRPVGLAKAFIHTFFAVMGFLVVAMIYFSSTGKFLRFELMIPGIIFIAFTFLLRYVHFPKQMKQEFFKQKELSAPFELEFTDNGMSTSNEFGTTTRPWGDFVKWKENRELLLLYHTDKVCSILPKRIFSDSQEIEIIKTYLKKNKIQEVTSRQHASCVVLIILFVSMVSIVIAGLRDLFSQ
jgi:hypothetical protein